MTIDYDRLRELAEYASPGPWKVEAEETSTCGDLIEGLAAWIEADNELVFGRGMEIEEDEELTNLALAALAPDMARELLRLRDGIAAQRDTCANTATVCRSSNDPDAPAVASTLESVAHSLTRLLKGHTE